MGPTVVVDGHGYGTVDGVRITLCKESKLGNII